MEPELSLPHLQVPTNCPNTTPDQPARATPSYSLNIHINIIIPSSPGSSKWSLSLRLPHRIPAYASPLPIRATCPAHIILFDVITLKIW